MTATRSVTADAAIYLARCQREIARVGCSLKSYGQRKSLLATAEYSKASDRVASVEARLAEVAQAIRQGHEVPDFFALEMLNVESPSVDPLPDVLARSVTDVFADCLSGTTATVASAPVFAKYGSSSTATAPPKRAAAHRVAATSSSDEDPIGQFEARIQQSMGAPHFLARTAALRDAGQRHPEEFAAYQRAVRAKWGSR